MFVWAKKLLRYSVVKGVSPWSDCSGCICTSGNSPQSSSINGLPGGSGSSMSRMITVLVILSLVRKLLKMLVFLTHISRTGGTLGVSRLALPPTRSPLALGWNEHLGAVCAPAISTIEHPKSSPFLYSNKVCGGPMCSRTRAGLCLPGAWGCVILPTPRPKGTLPGSSRPVDFQAHTYH